MMTAKASYYEEIEYGMSAERLGVLFDLDKKTVKELLKEVEPDGERRGTPFWRISTAAAYLVTPMGDLENYLRRIKPSDLPPKFQKEFWTALNLRTKYYQARGDLWSTSRVYEVVSKILSIVRSTSRLFVDELESNTTLTTKHRDAIQKEMDRMMGLMREGIKESFRDYDPSRDHVESLERDENAEQQPADDEENESGIDLGEEEDDSLAGLDDM